MIQYISKALRRTLGLSATLCAGWLLFSNNAEAQVRTERYTVESMPDNSVTYALPETRLYFVFEIEESESKPGDFALYASRYLGLSDVVMQESRSFALGAVRGGSYGIPSDSLKYTTRFSRRNSATNVTLASDGRLLGINAPEVLLPEVPVTKMGKFDSGDGFRALSSLPLEYVQATSAAKKAEIAASEIYRIRESRSAVISGESEQPFPDGEAMKVAIGGLDEAEKALIERFTGVTRSARHEIVVRGINPTEGEQVIARFSGHYGLLPADDLRGEPVYLSVKVTDRAPILDEREMRKKERQLSRGVVYTMPAGAEVTVTFRNQKVWEGTIPVAQYGYQEALESALFTDRDRVTEVLLDAASGGILKVQTL